MFIYGLFNKLFISLSLRNGMPGLLARYEINTDADGRRYDETQKLPLNVADGAEERHEKPQGTAFKCG